MIHLCGRKGDTICHMALYETLYLSDLDNSQCCGGVYQPAHLLLLCSFLRSTVLFFGLDD